MAKLYWRVKENGKWNWIAASDDNTLIVPGITRVTSLMYTRGEEE